ncbi:MAG: TrkH family potassium uptake protein [Euryarchaeota archaeon]|jgi:trk system potassium uptake protein TrkH|nr:TrkH family potassium uptake protein [Euryarchaeota archaeon]MBT4982960.1 TrkH family potassium uptake protein [Euryarchaeota archaeon]MBT5185016.1 TrkH family potassium uptake protein [Euryarchaeota archaeon]
MRRDVLSLIVGWTMMAMIIPLLFSFIITWWLDGIDLALIAFFLPILFSGMIGGALLTLGVRSDTTERLRDREAFAAVALAWPVAVLIGSLPFWLGGVFHGPFTDGSSMADIGRGFVNSWFESMSGYTTTGTTVIEHSMSPNCIPGTTPDCINAQPKGILIWRSLTQWLGGMGIIMLGLMLLSRVLGGGMALARAELTGPSLSRLRPKLQQTAIALWTIYIILTILEILLLWGVGDMSIFDAFNHGLTTMPTGGFSTHDASIGYYDSFVIESIIICFMFFAGVNFTLIWLAWERQWDRVFSDQEGRSYVLVIIATTLFVFFALMSQGGNVDEGFFDSLFTVMSIGTSTGYTVTDYMLWPVVTHVLLFLLMIVGACAGSTSGGLKLMRVKLALKVAWREIGRIVQPRRIVSIRMNGEVVENDRLSLIIGMLFVWTGLFAISCILLAITMPNSDFESVVAVVASSLGNVGPALGDYGPTNTWASMGTPSLLITSILMWFGRLELMTALLLIHPRTWKREEREAPDRASMKLIRELFEKMEEKLEEKKK